jgi:hypothetical protein
VTKGFNSFIYSKADCLSYIDDLSKNPKIALFENMIYFWKIISCFISLTLWVGTIVTIECNWALISILSSNQNCFMDCAGSATPFVSITIYLMLFFYVRY